MPLKTPHQCCILPVNTPPILYSQLFSQPLYLRRSFQPRNASIILEKSEQIESMHHKNTHVLEPVRAAVALTDKASQL